jgi:hypothetical protein
MNRIVALGLALAGLGSLPLAADPSGKQSAFCYVNLPQSTGYRADQPTYFSAAFQADNERYRGLFTQYVAKKFGWNNVPEGCSYGNDGGGVEKALQDRIAQAKAAGVTVVETGWVYGPNSAAEIAAMPQAPRPAVAARPAPAAPPKSPQQEAYERALEAQRPAAVGRDSAAARSAPGAAAPAAPASSAAVPNAVPPKPAAAAAPAAAKPAVAATAHYWYCHAVGMPPPVNGTQPRGYYYVSAVFSYVPEEHADQAFVDFLSQAHPTERIGFPQCSNPQATNATATETARQSEMATKRQQRANVVDTGWKPD